ncbi:60S ribosomal export protein NMD3 [Methanopyrus sp. SNP6]|uniref:NMD3-related protein n=1 Tax=Methanopyrus sp. SNP6 TaxID=1937005 RepID=UPI0011E5BE8E
MICHRCGREVDTTIDGLCPECYLEEHPIIEVPEGLEVRVCAQCLARYTGLRWEDPPESVGSTEELLVEYVLRELEENLRTLPDVDVRIEPLEVKGEPGGPGTRVLVELLADSEWEVGEEVFTRKYHLRVPVVFALCDRCMKFRSGYYEAILQVRSLRGKLTEREREEVENFVTEVAASLLERDPMAYISDVEYPDEGIDFYIGSLNAARKLARRLVDAYGGIVRESHKLVGFDRERGKSKYKATISVRIPHFRKGDILLVDGQPYLVTGLGERCSLRHLINGEVVKREWEEMKGVEVLKPEPAVVIEDTPPRVVLERTGETVECYESDIDLHVGQRVYVILLRGVAVIVPEEYL